MKKIFSTIILSCILFGINAQDLHFSQWDLNAAMRNPATMGQMEAGNKLTASYRTQWSNIPNSFRNMNLAYENRFDKMTWGFALSQNDAGENSLRTTNLLLSLGYQKKLSERDEILAIGASGGFIQQRFASTSLQFDNQYTLGEGFDFSMANRENFSKTNHMMPSVSAGVFLSKYFGRVKGSAGLSFAHLNQPSTEFFEGRKEIYPMRTSLFANAKMFFRKDISGEIQYTLNKQSVAREEIIGARVNYELSNKKWLVLGLGNRINDAWIMEAGVKFPFSTFTVSYDFNHSRLMPATNSNGALELAATFSFGKKEKYKQQPVAHPFDGEKEKPEEKIVLDGKPTVGDSDGDGILDNEDECPQIPGLIQFNGCNDRDQDGVWDSRDECPNLFGEKSNRGCPIRSIDSDRDGVVDQKDKCPFLKGTIEMEGCPDTDNDGVSDMEDRCPFLKGEQSNFGCPKMNKEEHQEFVKTKSAAVIVEFNSDKSIIQNKYFADLDRVALLLVENPNSEVFISGHTDDEGDSQYNYQLGKKRSEILKRYLMNLGVRSQQIVTISYGEMKPRNSNSSAFEKAKNRRAEVKVYLK